jgi:hypothetical protein
VLESPRSADNRARPWPRHRLDGDVWYTVVNGADGADRETDERLNLLRCSLADADVSIDTHRREALRETLASTQGRHGKLIDRDR